MSGGVSFFPFVLRKDLFFRDSVSPVQLFAFSFKLWFYSIFKARVEEEEEDEMFDLENLAFRSLLSTSYAEIKRGGEQW